MNDRYALEARKLAVKVTQQAEHIDMLDSQIDDLKRSIRRAYELIEYKNDEIRRLEKFRLFAQGYYPGCIDVFHALERLEGA